MKKINNFEKRTTSTIACEDEQLYCGDTIRVYKIESIHDLTQFIGFGKYINKQEYNVFMRGQTDLFDGKMIPSLFRGRSRFDYITSQYGKRMNEIKSSCPMFENYERNIMDSMLQHYGIKTPYIDLVDNVWVALWFSLHQAKSVLINSHEYVYYCDSTNEFSYIILIASDAIIPSEKQYGVYNGKDTTVIDLRKAIPSYFLRPHAQHAFMVKKNICYPTDYSDLIVGIAKIPTKLGLEWLGKNEFLTVRGLFPAPLFDSGFCKLLHDYPDQDQSTIQQYGSIQIISD